MGKRLFLAPMLDVTTPQFRKFIRLTCDEVTLYSEMIVAEYILHNDNYIDRFGEYDDNTVIQIGGSNPINISSAIQRIIDNSKFRNFNLNCGCPSSRVQSGCFGAVLMKDVDLVINILNKVYMDTNIIMSIKCRIGVDNQDDYIFIYNFIHRIITETKTTEFHIHARKCWLKGLSPAQNRTIPPLNYERVYKLKEDFKHLTIILNGGITDFTHCNNLDGIMIGREAIKDPFVFHKIIQHTKLEHYDNIDDDKNEIGYNDDKDEIRYNNDNNGSTLDHYEDSGNNEGNIKENNKDTLSHHNNNKITSNHHNNNDITILNNVNKITLEYKYKIIKEYFKDIN
ncbi:tRNA-dihydrouridine synthase A, partial [Spraguea lophii 42_110]